MIQTLLISMPGGMEWLIVLLGLALFGLWIYTMVEIITSKFQDHSNKTLWLVLVIFLGLLGTLIYWIVGRQNRVIIKES